MIYEVYDNKEVKIVLIKHNTNGTSYVYIKISMKQKRLTIIWFE